MATLNLNLDEAEKEYNESGSGYDLVPDGWYEAMVLKSDVVTSQGGAVIAKFEFGLLDEGYEKRKIWDQFCLTNKDGGKNTIGRGQVSKLGKALGKGGLVSDTSELHDGAFMIKVSTQKGTGINPKNGLPYGDKNVVKDFKSVEGAFKTAESNFNNNKAGGTSQYDDEGDINF